MSIVKDILKNLDSLECIDKFDSALDYLDLHGKNIVDYAEDSWKSIGSSSMQEDLAEALYLWYMQGHEKIEDAGNWSVHSTKVIGTWHEILHKTALTNPDQENPNILEKGGKVLCGFNVVKDKIFFLDSERRFNDLLNNWGNPRPGDCEKRQDLGEILDCLIRSIREPKSTGKIYPQKNLLDEILNKTKKAGLYCDDHLGGSAANMAFILSLLQVPVDLHVPYHSDALPWRELASTRGDTRCLQFDENTYHLSNVKESKPKPPYKLTVGFQFIPEWSSSRLNLEVSSSPRTLFIGSYPLSDEKECNKARIIWKNEDKVWSGDWDDSSSLWPYPNVFSRMEVNKGVSTFFPIDGKKLASLVNEENYTVALFRDIGYQIDHDLLQEAREEQLTALQEAGLPIHLELNPGFDFETLSSVIRKTNRGKGRPGWSGGLNQEELPMALRNILRTRSIPNHLLANLMPILDKERSLIQRFYWGYTLLTLLEIDWLYIHGNEIDIVIWDKTGCNVAPAGDTCRDSLLKAKLAIMLGMIERVPYPPFRQFVKDEIIGTPLATKGFWSVFLLSQKFAKVVEDLFGKSFSKKVVREQIREEGFFESEEIGFAIAPVFWPKAAQFLSATGVGDYSSAVVAYEIWKHME